MYADRSHSEPIEESRDPSTAHSSAQDDKIAAVRDPEDKNDKIGRNDPCWCGSGKKFKKCHGV